MRKEIMDIKKYHNLLSDVCKIRASRGLDFEKILKYLIVAPLSGKRVSTVFFISYKEAFKLSEKYSFSLYKGKEILCSLVGKKPNLNDRMVIYMDLSPFIFGSISYSKQDAHDTSVEAFEHQITYYKQE